MNPALWELARLLRRRIAVFDPVLLATIGLLAALSLVTMYSAAYDFPGRFQGHLRNMLIAFIVMWAAASVPPALMMRAAVPLFVAGIALLLAVALFGDISKGARRWLDLGFARIQPSELLKVATPLLLAWYFHHRQDSLQWFDYLIAALLLAIPVALIVRQPDLGTALLVLAAGGGVIFLAGLSWKLIAGLLASGAAAMPLVWSLLHDYQRQRILTLIDPSADPLGKGFHTIQSTIAVGSGGTFGKGWMQGTQTHLEFIPERTTDFIFAVFSEEFGLAGNLLLLTIYMLLITRGLLISGRAQNVFARLLAGALTLIFFVYAFVNMGMVSGVLPVVGVPLPLMSYGGTAMVSLGMGAGLLMSIARHRKRA
ncbi:MAG: rod shape-determining protein RodA, partial [Quisquiliibacterium sp.]